MSDKSFWQEMDLSASQKLTSIVQETASISITYSEDPQGVRTILKTSYRSAKRVTGGYTITQPNLANADGLLPVTV
jgi:hypothetical protein